MQEVHETTGILEKNRQKSRIQLLSNYVHPTLISLVFGRQPCSHKRFQVFTQPQGNCAKTLK